jgi:hypothetical protein
MTDRITDDIARDIVESIGAVRVVLDVERTARRITLHVSPRPDVPARRASDVESALLRKYGNSPYCLYQDIAPYRVTFGCN